MSRLALSDAAIELLADLPPYEADDTYAQAVVEAVANEYARIQAKADEILEHFAPSRAIDPYLGWWEEFLGLPVGTGLAVDEERRSLVLTTLRRQGAGTGAAWEASLNTLFEGSPWSYAEEGDYAVSLEVPYSSGTLSAVQAAALARRLTPAHLDIVPSSGGFIVGVSLVGQESL